VSAFEALARLDDSAKQRVLACIQELPPYSRPSTIEHALDGTLQDASLTTEALTGVFAVLEDNSPDTLALAIPDLSRSPNLDLDEIERATLASFLGDLLALPQLFSASKAEIMLLEGERLFLTSRIVTDIRPIFDADVSSPPRGAIIRHLLRIEYLQQNGDRETIFFELDPDDLEELGATIGRAKQKGKSIESLFPQAGLSLYDPSEDPDDA
jgi:hypothetical protein